MNNQQLILKYITIICIFIIVLIMINNYINDIDYINDVDNINQSIEEFNNNTNDNNTNDNNTNDNNSKKIALCFLIYEGINHEELWYKWLENVDKSKYNIYIHYKHNNQLKYFSIN